MNNAVIDNDRKIKVIIPPGYTLRDDGIVLSEGGKDCLQNPDHRGGTELAPITAAEAQKFQDANIAAAEARQPKPTRYLSKAGKVTKTKPAVVTP